MSATATERGGVIVRPAPHCSPASLLQIALLAAIALVVSTCRQQDKPDEPPDCSETLCGCWRDTTLAYQTRVVTELGTPIHGMEISCGGEREPLARSDASGLVVFTVQTAHSPGCHFQRCTSVVFRHPQGTYQDTTATVMSTNGGVVSFSAAADSGAGTPKR